MDSLKIADLNRDIVGADRGYNVGADVLTRTADGVLLDSIWNDYQTSLGVWNRGRNVLAALFTTGTTDPYENLPLDGGKVDLEKASEFGIPQAGRALPGYYPVGFDLQWYDFASRFTRKFLRDARAAQVNAIHQAALEADNRLVFNTIMNAVMTPTGGSFGSRLTNPEGNTIYSLYAGATDDKPPTAPDGTTFAANHTHFLVSGAATVDSGDLDDLIVKITEHGRGLKINNERVVVIVNEQEAKVIRGFRVADGDSYDFIPTPAEPAYLTDQTIIGDLPPAEFNGLPVEGSYGDALIIKHPLAKAGYMVAVAAGGEKALAFRENPNVEDRGFRLVQGMYAKYPLIESIYERGFGVGVRRREAAAVIQIKASGSYTAPTWS